MMPPSLLAGGVFGLALLGIVGYAFVKGERSCANSFIAKQLRAELALKNLRIKQQEDTEAEAKKLTEETLAQAKLTDDKYQALINAIKDGDSGVICIDDGFLRDLERARGKH